MLLDLCDKQNIHDCLFQRGCDSYNLNHITSHLVIYQTLIITSKPATKKAQFKLDKMLQTLPLIVHSTISESQKFENCI